MSRRWKIFSRRARQRDEVGLVIGRNAWGLHFWDGTSRHVCICDLDILAHSVQSVRWVMLWIWLYIHRQRMELNHLTTGLCPESMGDAPKRGTTLAITSLQNPYVTLFTGGSDLRVFFWVRRLSLKSLCASI